MKAHFTLYVVLSLIILVLLYIIGPAATFISSSRRYNPRPSFLSASSALRGPAAEEGQRWKSDGTFTPLKSLRTWLGHEDNSTLPHILVVTPVKDASSHVHRYMRLLANISAGYPPARLSLSILDGDSSDVPSAQDLALVRALEPGLDTAGMSATSAQFIIAAHQLRVAGWAGVTITRHDLGYKLDRDGRHAHGVQEERRGALARARNHALYAGLQSQHEWVLWLDSDLAKVPQETLSRMLQAVHCARGEDEEGGPGILVPNVVMSPGGRSYDLNSWRGADAPGNDGTAHTVRAWHDEREQRACKEALQAKSRNALRACSSAGSGELQLEGYGRTGALYVHKLRRFVGSRAAEGDKIGACGLARVDGVGGGMLLVRAQLHRHGLIFPVSPYRHRIETEGLAMMALDMGEMAYAVPLLEVQHK